MSQNGQPLDGRLVGLEKPTEQPKEHKAGRTALPHSTVQFDAVVCSAIVERCVKGEWFSAASLYEELDFFKHGMQGWSPISRLCENGGRALMLWSRYTFYVPCRENAAKALVRVWGPHLDRLVDSLGFASVEELVAHVNRLPSGLEVGNRECAKPAEADAPTERRATDAAVNLSNDAVCVQ
jgi:hypothetical protein